MLSDFFLSAGVGVFFIFLILLPAVIIGVFSLLIYYALAKLQPPKDRFALAGPVVVGLLFCLLAPFVGRFSLVTGSVIMAMGLLTTFMAVRRFFPDRFRYKLLFLGSVVAVSGRLLYGFGMASESGGAGSPVFQLLTSLSSTDQGFLIMNSLAGYLEMVLISAGVFGVLFVIMTIVQKIVDRP
jgi:hypothetical protein